jgi:hypothetical protein
MNRAYQRATNKMVDGALTMQQIDKQRELDRYLARQQKPKTPVNEAQTDSESVTTATAPSADIGLSHGEANHV